jgi:hypothetical protein
MNRILAEDGIRDLIAASSLGPLLTTLEVTDGTTAVISEENQLLLVPPAVVIAPSAVVHSGADLYGRTGATETYLSIILAGFNYRGGEARNHGDELDPDGLGVYQMAEIVRDALRGKNAYSTSDDPANRIFLEREEPGPWVSGGVVYTLTVKIRGQLQP